jgi:transposase
MEYGAIDLHLRHSQIRIVREDGSVILDRRVSTTRDSLTALFDGRPRLRVVVETGTESEWVAQTVEACGHEVVVVDPNYALMYGTRQRRIKTDRRDVAGLAEANRRGIYRTAHRVSASQRQQRRVLRVRGQLIRVRTQAINLLRAQLRQEGYRLAAGSAECAVPRYRGLTLPAPLAQALAPVIALLEHLGPAIATANTEAKVAAHQDPIVRRLTTAPGVGAITGLTYRAVVDDIRRFRDAGAASAYFGLVPREDSSAERQCRGRITKAGPSIARSLLIQAAWSVWRQRARDPLQLWVRRLADRRGRRIAVVALARRLCRILYAMWRDDTDYQPAPLAVV